MNYGLVLDSSDIKKILAEYFNVEEDKIVKTKYSYIVVQNIQTVNQEMNELMKKEIARGKA